MNMLSSVNNDRRPDELELLLAAKLDDLLASVPWLKVWSLSSGASLRKSGWDVEASLSLPTGGRARLLVECKRDLRPAQFPLLASRIDASPGMGTVPVLALPYVSPRMAQTAQQHNWSWYDLAGNCWIDVPGLLRIERSGNPPLHQARRPDANLGSPEAARVLRALLVPQHAGRIWTQRELQVACLPSVSLGLVNKVVRHLRDEAFLVATADRGFRLADPQGALLAWAAAYRFDRHARRGYFTLLQGRKLAEALARLGEEAGSRVIYASFSAAGLQAPHVRQPRTWLYLAPEAEPLFRAVLEAAPVDSGDNLIVLFPGDEGVFYLTDRAPNRLAATNPAQTYVDLVHSGGRGEEAAEALLEQRLKPAWAAGTAR